MKILMTGVDLPNHPLYTYAKGFRELGHDVTIIDTRQILKRCANPTEDMYAYDVLKKRIKVSDLNLITDIEQHDFMFAQQTWLHMQKDKKTHIPVFYLHSEMQAPITMYGADHVGIGYWEGINQLRRYYPKDFFGWKTKELIWFGIDPDQYTPVPADEKIEGIHIFKHADHRLEATRQDSPYWSRTIYTFRDAVLKKYENDIIVHDHVPYEEYKKTLPTFETVAIIHGNGSYISQRIFEAVIAGCKIKVFHENELSYQVIAGLGEHTREHFLKHHTYLNRARQVIRQVEDYI